MTDIGATNHPFNTIARYHNTRPPRQGFGRLRSPEGEERPRIFVCFHEDGSTIFLTPIRVIQALQERWKREDESSSGCELEIIGDALAESMDKAKEPTNEKYRQMESSDLAWSI